MINKCQPHLQLELCVQGENLEAMWEKWLAQGDRGEADTPSSERKPSEGFAGMVKLTDGINVGPNLHLWQFAIAINYENEGMGYLNDLRWVNYSESLSVRSISRNSWTDRWKPFLFSDRVISSSVCRWMRSPELLCQRAEEREGGRENEDGRLSA